MEDCTSQEYEIERLRMQNRKLKRIINCLLETIAKTAGYADTVRNTSSVVLAQKSGVPRGKWAYHKGRYEVAENVLFYLSNDCLG